MEFLKKTTKAYLLLAKKLRRKRHRLLLLTGISFSWLAILLSIYSYTISRPLSENILGAGISNARALAENTLISPVVTIPLPTQTPAPTLTPKPTTKPTPFPTKSFAPAKKPKPTSTPELKNPTQYTAKQINSNTWRVSNVQNDDKMASAQDVFNALNSYRGAHGLPNLSWDSKLGDFAQSRADLFSKNGALDGHAGFTSYMNEGGFEKSGFNGLGENSAYLAGPMNGERIIKSIFGADSSHDGNQLDPSWTHVGVGVNGVAVNVNFGKNKR